MLNDKLIKITATSKASLLLLLEQMFDLPEEDERKAIQEYKRKKENE